MKVTDMSTYCLLRWFRLTMEITHGWMLNLRRIQRILYLGHTSSMALVCMACVTRVIGVIFDHDELRKTLERMYHILEHNVLVGNHLQLHAYNTIQYCMELYKHFYR